MGLSKEPLITADAIAKRVVELAAAISRDYAHRDILVLVVLKGAAIFAADLIRHLATPARLEFVRARSYTGRRSAGAVEITVWPERSLAGQDVLVIEDILDTGRTTAAILDRVEAEGPASLAYCALLDKPSGRVCELRDGYTGFTIGGEFVVGYGLDYNEHYRELPAIHLWTPSGPTD